MVDKYIIELLIASVAILLMADIVLLIKQNKTEKHIEELVEQQNIKNKKMDSTETEVSDLVKEQVRYREHVQMAIMAETAKFGLHPSEYMAKHAKKEEQK